MHLHLDGVGRCGGFNGGFDCGCPGYAERHTPAPQPAATPCRDCGQPVTDEPHRPGEYEHAQGCPSEPAREQWVCPSCGPGVAADEDGCCATCGADCLIAPAPQPGARMPADAFGLSAHTPCSRCGRRWDEHITVSDFDDRECPQPQPGTAPLHGLHEHGPVGSGAAMAAEYQARGLRLPKTVQIPPPPGWGPQPEAAPDRPGDGGEGEVAALRERLAEVERERTHARERDEYNEARRIELAQQLAQALDRLAAVTAQRDRLEKKLAALCAAVDTWRDSMVGAGLMSEGADVEVWRALLQHAADAAREGGDDGE